MHTIEDKAEILDLNQFRQQKQQQPDAPQYDAVPGFKPMLVWYPMWVMVPDQPANPVG